MLDDDGTPARALTPERAAAAATALRRAVEDRALLLRYQPIVELTTGRIVGAEALARWPHPAGGVSPEVFIPIAESTGTIVPLGRWVLHEACRAAMSWGGSGASSETAPTVSVNVSGVQLQHPRFLEDVTAALRASGLAPHRLVLEMTETVLVADMDAAIGRLEALRALGIRLALDDFGTGYSSLAYLHRLPVDVVKIDRVFAIGMLAVGRRAAVARAVVDLATTLGLDTVAEGVETEDQEAALAGAGCRLGQGYLYAQALEPEAFEAALRARGTGRMVAPVPACPHLSVAADATSGCGDSTVLVVDDDEHVRRATRRVLECGGYAVLEARDGADALRLLSTTRTSVHLVLTDVVMPELSGRSLAAALASCAPHARVLFMSGFVPAAPGPLDTSVCGGRLLPKPFTPERLLRAVDACLAEATG